MKIINFEMLCVSDLRFSSYKKNMTIIIHEALTPPFINFYKYVHIYNMLVQFIVELL